MVVVGLIGGLGNQMFQYAVGRCLAARLNTVLKLDVSGFDEWGGREYALRPMAIVGTVLPEPDLAALKARKSTWWGRLIGGLPDRRPPLREVCEKKHFRFDPAVLQLGDNVYLKGSWQNAKYFVEIEDTIRDEFKVRKPPAGENRELLTQIRSCSSVAVHVRRGDYVNNPGTNRIHGVCGLEYYSDAMARVTGEVKGARFFVFSDEPGWAREQFESREGVTVVGHNGEHGCHEDLRLMRECRHHIIANSTFSWWGAWLAGRAGGLVIAPARWLLSPDYDTGDLLPESWIKM